ncbi:MAG: hypothetical protein EI684_22235 [Candidatus Viridilinea halotolerans]|uniref:Uncharacterized protein n=1 Tax=Candidatus Viridilinea halotolerans TaxID=2491704 RepID=A0A426TQW5_9CHLR|nr:MAG: hypothetical protein EI684_22235 [Candidatus Viridilinea halotolerans]
MRFQHRLTLILLLILLLVTVLPPLLFMAGVPAFVRRPEVMNPLAGGTALILGGVLLFGLGRRAVRSVRAWRTNQRTLPLTGQHAARFHAASSDAVRAANEAAIERLAAQGYTIPGFQSQHPDQSILIFLRGCGQEGATVDQIATSIGMDGPTRDSTLRALYSDGLAQRDGENVVITELGVNRIAHV